MLTLLKRLLGQTEDTFPERLLRAIAFEVGATEALLFTIERPEDRCDVSVAVHLRGGRSRTQQMREAEEAAKSIIKEQFRDPVYQQCVVEVETAPTDEGRQFFVAFVEESSNVGIAVVCRRETREAATEVVAKLREPIDVMKRNDEAAA